VSPVSASVASAAGPADPADGRQSLPAAPFTHVKRV
jgi:hypothetical protein